MIGLQQKKNQPRTKSHSDFEFMLGVLQGHCLFQLEQTSDELEKDAIIDQHYDQLCRKARAVA